MLARPPPGRIPLSSRPTFPKERRPLSLPPAACTVLAGVPPGRAGALLWRAGGCGCCEKWCGGSARAGRLSEKLLPGWG